MMRPGVVWFGESLDPLNIARVEDFLARGPCDIVLVVGTTATFEYIVTWARRAAGRTGTIIEVNPEDTPLSPLATTIIRGTAATVLPDWVTAWLTGRG
jgi:NAD-dependent deacetylase